MKFNVELLQAALVGLEMKMARLEERIASVRAMTIGKTSLSNARVAKSTDDSPLEKKPRKKRRTLSPEARQRIADGQKKRWAAARAT